jgi:hypothetical protein
MADPTKVYQGGIPNTYDTQMVNAGFGISGEGESTYVPGKVDAPSPKTVNQGGPTPSKTYNKQASEDFLGNSSYQSFSLAASNWTNPGNDVDNPDTISRSDTNDDPDLPKK